MAAITLNPLHRADGSASCSRYGHTVVAAVSGPIEVQRRDELPEEAAIDVAIRPASGVGGVRERHLESIIQNTLRHVILVAAHPRTLVQITLQILNSPGDESASGTLPQAASNLPVLPALLQASMLALLCASIPMSIILSAALVVVQPDGALVFDPSSNHLKSAASIHVLAFSSHSDTLIVESEGDFSIETWEQVHEKAGQLCHGQEKQDSDDEDMSMDSYEKIKLENIMRDAVQEKVTKERKWKEELG